MKRIVLLALAAIALGACTSNGPALSVPTNTAINNPISETSSPTSEPAVSPSPEATLSGGISAPTQTITTTPTVLITPTVPVALQASGPTNFPANIDPLTGLQAANPAILNRRPVSVKVQLFPRMQRPVYGVSLADLVFEYYSSGGMSRLNVIFYGQDATKVRPVRSARLFDIHLIRMFKSLFVFGGADDRILSKLNSAEFSGQLINGNSLRCPAVCREDPNGANYMIVNTAEVSKLTLPSGVTNTRQNLDGLLFNPQAPTGGTPVSKITTHFTLSSYNFWEYKDGIYLRSQDTSDEQEIFAPMVDGLNNQQIAASNVVVLFVPTANIAKNSEIIDIKLDPRTSGVAYAFRDGQGYKLKWNRAGENTIFNLTSEDGKTPYALKPGNTWFEVIGQSSGWKDEGQGAWRFTYTTP